MEHLLCLVDSLPLLVYLLCLTLRIIPAIGVFINSVASAMHFLKKKKIYLQYTGDECYVVGVWWIIHLANCWQQAWVNDGPVIGQTTAVI